MISFGLLEFIVENSPVATIVTDSEGIVEICNIKHNEMTHYPREKIIGINIGKLVDEGVINSSSSLDVVKRGKPLLLEQTINKGTPYEKDIMVHSIPFKDENNTVVYAINYLYEISEKTNLLNQLQEAEFNNEKYRFELEMYRKKENRSSKFIFKSNSMNNLISKIEQIAPTDSTVLLTGESGTGKTVLAKYIHTHSRRSQQSFFSINCGAIPSNLIESELFGYEKGAFSGADAKGKQGIFDFADKGTLLLDEIGELPFELQVKLLTVLQDGEFYRVGGTKLIKVDVRIIAATNANLKEKIMAKEFRLDLYYRLNVISFTIPPIRERPEDIPVLVESIVTKLNNKLGTNKKLTVKALHQLTALPLYGNVREIENIIESNILFTTVDIIDKLEFPDFYAKRSFADLGMDTQKTMENNNLPIEKNNLLSRKEKIEKEQLIQAAKIYRTTTELGEYFNVHQSTISRKLRKYGINLKTIKKK